MAVQHSYQQEAQGPGTQLTETLYLAIKFHFISADKEETEEEIFKKFMHGIIAVMVILF
jgi:hypothetical protein